VKRLYLLRHAKSEWDSPVSRDFDRPLSRRGRKAARAMGREMRAPRPRLRPGLASPATRVVETLTELAQGYGHAVDTSFDEAIYLAPVETLLALVRPPTTATPACCWSATIPAWSSSPCCCRGRGAARPDRRQISDRRAGRDRLRRGALGRGRAGRGRLARFIRPRELAEGLGPDD
jgi:phosphohistidine phosphatase